MTRAEFEDQVVVITGLLGGLGLAIAGTFADAGARVIGIDRDSCEAPFPTIAADISDATAVAAAFAEIDERFGVVDVLINNAGIREVASILELSTQEWDRVISVNLNGTFYAAKEAATRMVKRGHGVIINMSSVSGMTGITHRPAYNASKHAIIGLTRNLALDLGPRGIRVCAVAPGTVRTPLTEPYYDDPGFLADLEEAVPLGTGGDVTAVADACFFLASSKAAFLSGVVLPVDGGFTAGSSYSRGHSSAYTDTRASTA